MLNFRRTTVRLVLMAVIGLSLTVSVPSEAGDTKSAKSRKVTDAQAISIQKRFFDAMIAQDAAAMEALSSDDMIYIHLNGLKQSKAEFLSWVSNRSFKSFDLQDTTVHAYQGAFVLNGLVEDTRKMHLYLTTVWEQRPRGWQMVLLQYTGVPETKKN